MKLLCYILTVCTAMAGEATNLAPSDAEALAAEKVAAVLDKQRTQAAELSPVASPAGGQAGLDTRLDKAVGALSKDALRPPLLFGRGNSANKPYEECMEGVLARIKELKGQLEYIASIVEVLKEEDLVLQGRDSGGMLASTAHSVAVVNGKAVELQRAVQSSLRIVSGADADLATTCVKVERLMQELLGAVDEVKRELHVKPAKKKHADRKKSKKNVDADRK